MSEGHHSLHARDWADFALLTLFWGAAFLWVEWALESIEPLSIVAARVLMGWLGLALFLKLRGEDLHIILHEWRIYGMLGALIVMPFLCFAWGQQYVDSGLAGVINSAAPLFTLMLAVAMGQEQVHRARICGLILGMLGVAVVLGTPLGGHPRALWGALACLLAPCFYAIGTVLARHRVMHRSPLQNACGQLFYASLISAPLALVFESPLHTDHGLRALAGIACLGFFSTFWAFIAYYHILDRSGATNATLVTFTVPLVAVLLGVLVLGEVFDARFFFGAAMVIASLTLIDRKLRRRVWGWLHPAPPPDQS